MKEFKEDSACKACGCDDISSKYIKNPEKKPSEFIQRTCNRCGYRWSESTLLKESVKSGSDASSEK